MLVNMLLWRIRKESRRQGRRERGERRRKISSSKYLTCEWSFSLWIDLVMNGLPNFFSESDSGPASQWLISPSVKGKRFSLGSSLIKGGRWCLLVDGSMQVGNRGSSQVGKEPLPSLHTREVVPCSWEQTLLSVGTTAPSPPGAMPLRGSASPDLDCQSASLFTGAWHWLFRCPRVHLPEHLCRWL